MTTEKPPNPIAEPYEAATWLVNRHEGAERLIARVDAWETTHYMGTYSRIVDLEKITEGLTAYDQYRADWEDYERRTPPPVSYRYTDDQAYERAWNEWSASGPTPTNDFAYSYGPMSSGEHRFFRVIGIFRPSPRIRFCLDDATGISFQCCSPDLIGGPRPHDPFLKDWARLVLAGMPE